MKRKPPAAVVAAGFYTLALLLLAGTCNSTEISNSYDRKLRVNNKIGYYRLPNRPFRWTPPQNCTPAPDSAYCAPERNDRFSEAMQLYESHFEDCGMAGWVKLRELGVGRTATVALRTTPCGKRVAMKGAHSEEHAYHMEIDCRRLKQLEKYRNTPECVQCFPEFYYFSNMTGNCYSEFIPSVSLDVFFDHINANSSAGFKHIRKAWLQGLNLLEILQKEGIVHQDLAFHNILVRVPSKEALSHAGDYNIVLIDFGAAFPVRGAHPAEARRLTGNLGKIDAHAFSCAFYDHFFPGWKTCLKLITDQVPTGAPGSFRAYLVDMIKASQIKLSEMASFPPFDYPAYRALFENVQHL